jgi:hypothetical protein
VIAYNNLGLVDLRAFALDHPQLIEIDRRGRKVTFYARDDTQHFIDEGLIAEIVPSLAEHSADVAGPDPDGGE